MRDAADAEEKWEEGCPEDGTAAMVTAGLCHGLKKTSVTAAHLAEDAAAATERLSVKVKYADGRTATTNLVVKNRHRVKTCRLDMCAMPCMTNSFSFAIRSGFLSPSKKSTAKTLFLGG